MSAFKGKKSKISVEVTAELSGDDLVKTKESFRPKYKKLSVSVAKETMRRAGLSEDDSKRLTDEDIIKRDLVTWDELEDNDGKPLVYDAVARDEAMEIDGYHKALMCGWFLVQFNQDLTKAKN